MQSKDELRARLVELMNQKCNHFVFACTGCTRKINVFEGHLDYFWKMFNTPCACGSTTKTAEGDFQKDSPGL